MARQKEVSMANLAQAGFGSLQKYLDSNDEIDRLLAFNAILVTSTFAFLFAGNFLHSIETISFTVYLLVGGLFGAIILLVYLPFIDVIKKIIRSNYFAFNFSVAILLITLSLAIVGALSLQQTYLQFALYGLIIQFVGLLVFGLVIRVEVKQQIQQVSANSGWKFFWIILDKLSALGGAIGFVILFLKFLGLLN